MRDRVTVVWCDFGGVLTPPLGEAIASVVRAAAVPWDELRRAADEVATDFGLAGFQPLELGLLSQAEWGSRMTERLAQEFTPQVDLGLWGDHWYRDRPVNSELLRELERIAASGVRVGLLTNSVLEWEPHRAAMLGGSGPFECEVRSHEIGLAKPDPRIFAYADHLMTHPTGLAMLIDDFAANCAAADAHGWMGLHHTDTSLTIRRLRESVS